MNGPVPLARPLELISQTHVEIYRFDAAGHVSATLGTTNGPVCAPILDYSVLGACSIRLVHGDGMAVTWTNIELEGDVLRAECDGQVKAFRIG